MAQPTKRSHGGAAATPLPSQAGVRYRVRIVRRPSARATASWSSSAATRSGSKVPGAGWGGGRRPPGPPRPVPLPPSSAGFPAPRGSCARRGAMQPAGPKATQRRGTEATAGAGAIIGTRESRAAPPTPAATAPARASSWRRVSSADVEPLPAQPVDVVGQADDEEEGDQHEADDRGPLDQAVGDRTPTDLLGHGPEDMAAVQGQEGEEIHHGEGERDDREDAQRLDGVELEGLARGLVGADHARDVLARLRVVEDADDRGRGELRDPPEVLARDRHRVRGPDVLVGAVGDAEQHALGLSVVLRRDEQRHALAVALHHDLRRRGRLAAGRRRPRAGVPGDDAAQAQLAVDDLLVAQAGLVARDTVDRQHLVAGAELVGRCAGRLDLVDHEVVHRHPVEGDDRPAQQEGDEQVHGWARRDNDDALPRRLVEVGPRGDLRRELLVGAHPGDLHVAAERDRPDGVLGLAAADLAQQRREEEREALDAHPGGLGRGEVPELVQDDERGEAEEGEQPAQVRTAISSDATVRASRSASYSDSKARTGPPGRRSSAVSMTAGMPRKSSPPLRKAWTATSLAALSTHGAVPPAAAASRARRRHGKASVSTGSKVSAPTSARSSGRTGTSTRSG